MKKLGTRREKSIHLFNVKVRGEGWVRGGGWGLEAGGWLLSL